MEGGVLDAAALLATVVIEQAEDVLAEADDGYEVAGGEEGHEEVAQIPDELQRGEGAEHHQHTAREQAVDDEGCAVGGDEADIGLTIIIIADDTGEGEEKDGNGDESGSPRPNLGLQGGLRQGDAIELRNIVEAADKNDERRAGADEQGVREDSQRLYQPLLHGVRHRGGGCYIGCAALAGLVAEQASLDAIHDGCTYHAACRLAEPESIGKDDMQHMRYLLDVHHDDDHRQHEVADGHQWNQHGADIGNAMDAAEDDEQRHHGQDDTHGHGIPPEGLLHGTADGVALDGVVGQSESERYQHGKQHGHPVLVQSFLDIVGGASDERLLMALLKELTQR